MLSLCTDTCNTHVDPDKISSCDKKFDGYTGEKFSGEIFANRGEIGEHFLSSRKFYPRAKYPLYSESKDGGGGVWGLYVYGVPKIL